MKTAISIPDPLFQAAEAEAKRQGISRSKLIQNALERYLAERRGAAVTLAMNRAVERDGALSTEDEVLLEHNRHRLAELLKDDEWSR